MKDILGLLPPELNTELESIGEKKFRAGQIFTWLHVKRVTEFAAMTNLSKELREKLSETYHIPRLFAERHQKSAIDNTQKVLFRLEDGNFIEAVFMSYHHGNTICVSTQVGCRMSCKFCASTIMGLERNLTASEILSEVYEMERVTGEEISNVVLMGSGEPFDNYGEVVRFLRLITAEQGRNMSVRNITLSTSGLPDQIRTFAAEGLPVTLALSLHASTDEKRRELMPVARKYDLKSVLSACDEYFEKTGRRVSYEYAVVEGVNDQAQDVAELRNLLGGKNAHMNLIPVNPVRERSFKRPSKEHLYAFQNALEKVGINATIRRELGSDIDGACGQLRAKRMEEEPGKQEESS